MVGVLGPVRVWRAGRLLPAGPAQQQLVLAVLALGAGTAVPREELVDALWEQAPAGAVNIVHKHICALRAVLEPGRPRRGGQLLASVAGGYELRLAPGAVDALAFARDTARAAELGTGPGLALAGLLGRSCTATPASNPPPATPGAPALPGMAQSRLRPVTWGHHD